MNTPTRTARAPEVIAPGAGTHLHFLNHLATVKVSPGEHGTMSVVQFRAPRGFAPPLHLHRDEDELFFIEEGRLAFHIGDEVMEADAGTVAHLPCGLAHTFQVISSEAVLTNVTASRVRAPRFDQMVAALGEPAAAPVLPEPRPIDPARVADVCAEHGIDILGPPPAPLPSG
jgi:mannose-6-phosphate isomerase-like protein (cupin superfamily)